MSSLLDLTVPAVIMRNPDPCPFWGIVLAVTDGGAFFRLYDFDLFFFFLRRRLMFRDGKSEVLLIVIPAVARCLRVENGAKAVYPGSYRLIEGPL